MVTRDYLPQVACDDPTRPLRMLAFRKDCPGYPMVRNEGGSDDEGIRSVINTLLQPFSSMPSTTSTVATSAATTITPPPPPIISSPTSSTSSSLPAWKVALDKLYRVKNDPKGVLKVLP